MEKRTPHYKLSVIKAMIKAQKVRATLSALTGGAALGFDVEGIIGVIMALTQKNFYKSMTTYTDHRIWQDVYRPKGLERNNLGNSDPKCVADLVGLIFTKPQA